MTLIIGLTTAEGMLLGSDSSLYGGYFADDGILPKTTQIWDTYLGVSGVVRTYNLLRDLPQSALTCLADSTTWHQVGENLRTFLKERDGLQVKEGVPQMIEDGKVLLGQGGWWVQVDAGFGVSRHPQLAAIGAGAITGLACLRFMREHHALTQDDLGLALRVSGTFEWSVRPPYNIELMPGDYTKHLLTYGQSYAHP